MITGIKTRCLATVVFFTIANGAGAATPDGDGCFPPKTEGGQFSPLSVVPYCIPAYTAKACAPHAIAAVYRIYLDPVTLLASGICAGCITEMKPAKDGSDNDDGGLESVHHNKNDLPIESLDWKTPIDLDVSKWTKTTPPAAEPYKPVLIEVVSTNRLSSFFYPYDAKSEYTHYSQFAVRASEHSNEKGLFSCRQMIAADPKTGHDVIKFRMKFVNKFAGGINIGLLARSPDPKIRVPFYIDPHMGNNGFDTSGMGGKR